MKTVPHVPAPLLVLRAAVLHQGRFKHDRVEAQHLLTVSQIMLPNRRTTARQVIRARLTPIHVYNQAVQTTTGTSSHQARVAVPRREEQCAHQAAVTTAEAVLSKEATCSPEVIRQHNGVLLHREVTIAAAHQDPGAPAPIRAAAPLQALVVAVVQAAVPGAEVPFEAEDDNCISRILFLQVVRC